MYREKNRASVILPSTIKVGYIVVCGKFFFSVIVSKFFN